MCDIDGSFFFAYRHWSFIVATAEIAELEKAGKMRNGQWITDDQKQTTPEQQQQQQQQTNDINGVETKKEESDTQGLNHAQQA